MHVLKHVDVPETYDTKSMSRQQFGALFIATQSIWNTVLTAIDFDDELGTVASKVCNGTADRNLAAKVKTFAL